MEESSTSSANGNGYQKQKIEEESVDPKVSQAIQGCILNGLVDLNLRACCLRLVPTELGTQLHGLRSLNLSMNQLGQLPSSMAGLGGSLTALDASRNSISGWEGNGEWIGNLHGLVNLNLMANQLDMFPADALAKLTQLISLGLKSNRIRELPSTIGHCSKLVHLFLTDNLLESLPKELVACTSLRKIQAASNQIAETPAELACMHSLEFCRLPCNKLTTWPSIMRAPHISWAALAGNPVTNRCVKTRLPELPEASLSEKDLGTTSSSDSRHLQVLGSLGAVSGASGDLKTAKISGCEDEVVLKTFLVDAEGQQYVSPDGRPEDELAAARYVSHNCLVRPLAIVKDLGDGTGRTGLVMAKADGQILGGVHSFTSVLRPPTLWRGEPVSAQWLAACFGDLSAALHHLHAECGLAHGDVFAHNVLVAADGRSTLCDFGAAFFYDRTDVDAPAFELQEVRAFGILLLEFLDRASRSEPPEDATADKAYRALQTLGKACKSDVQARPCFETVTKELRAIEKVL